MDEKKALLTVEASRIKKSLTEALLAVTKSKNETAVSFDPISLSEAECHTIIDP